MLKSLLILVISLSINVTYANQKHTEISEVAFTSGKLGNLVATHSAHILVSFLNEESTLSIEVGPSGDYEIELGSLKIFTYHNNPDGNFALYNAIQKVLYLEVPKYNLVIELEVTSNLSNIEHVKVRAGQIDSIAQLQEVGEFSGQKNFSSH